MQTFKKGDDALHSIMDNAGATFAALSSGLLKPKCLLSKALEIVRGTAQQLENVYHAVDSLSRQNQKLVRHAGASVLLQNYRQISADGVSRASVPGVIIRSLMAGQHVDKALFFRAAEHSGGVRPRDVRVQRV